MTKPKPRMRIYLTLRCNQQCSYCVNRHNLREYAGDQYKEITPKAWLKIIKQHHYPVIFTGGEPFLYRGLIPLVARVPESRVVRIYTNLTINPTDFVHRVKREVGFLISYHPKVLPFEKLIEHLDPLMTHSQFHGMVHTVDLPEHRPFIQRAIRYFDDVERWDFSLAEDQRKLNLPMTGQKRRIAVDCTRINILVAPNGVRYPCASLLLRRKAPLEDLKVCRLRRVKVVLKCRDYGYCCPCDAASRGSCVLK